MNLDDESLLSAFFDDELDPGERASVAGAVDSSPELAGLLVDFAGVRATLRSLDHPTLPVDLASTLRDRLAALAPLLADEAGSELEVIALPEPKTAPRRRRWAGPARLAASFVGVGSVAASLLFALVLLFQALHETTRPGGIPALVATPHLRNHPSDPSPTSQPQAAPSVVVAAPAPSASPTATDIRADLDKSPPALARSVAAKAKSDVNALGDDRPEDLNTMLGQTRVVRVAVAAEAPDRAVARVREIVEQDPDRDARFGRIALPPGLVVDPNRPGPAEVYAVVLREGDDRTLVARLRAEFPDAAVEAEASPDLVTQLTEVGDGEVLAKTPPAKLGVPPVGLPVMAAVKDARPPDLFRAAGPVQPERDVPAGQVESVTPEAQARARAVALAESATPGKPTATKAPAELAVPLAVVPPAADRSGPVTVLIWITRSAPR